MPLGARVVWHQHGKTAVRPGAIPSCCGNYTKQIEGGQNLVGVVGALPHEMSVPSNYGCVWTV